MDDTDLTEKKRIRKSVQSVQPVKSVFRKIEKFNTDETDLTEKKRIRKQIS